MTIIFIKLVLAILLSVFSFGLSTQKVLIESFAANNRSVFFVTSFLLLRIVPFYLVYILFDFSPTSDVPIFYESAQGAINGGFVYKDFQTVYSPLFPYLIAVILPFWSSTKAIVLILILFEMIAVYLTDKLSDSNNKSVRMLFYLALPSGMVFSLVAKKMC